MADLRKVRVKKHKDPGYYVVRGRSGTKMKVSGKSRANQIARANKRVELKRRSRSRCR